MAKKKRADTTDAVDALISDATNESPAETMRALGEGELADSMETLERVVSDPDAAIDALDAARDEPEPEVSPEDAPAAQSDDPPRRKRGRPAGSRSSSPAVAEAGELPKTKAAALDALKAARAERDAQRARADMLAASMDTEAVKNLGMGLSGAFKIMCALVAKRRGAHWKIDDEEASALGDAYGQALAPYMDKLGAVLPWTIAAGVTYGVFKPRVEQDAELSAPVRVIEA